MYERIYIPNNYGVNETRFDMIQAVRIMNSKAIDGTKSVPVPKKTVHTSELTSEFIICVLCIPVSRQIIQIHFRTKAYFLIVCNEHLIFSYGGSCDFECILNDA